MTAPDGKEGDVFGISSSMDGNHAIIAAYDDVNGEMSGSTYLFQIMNNVVDAKYVDTNNVFNVFPNPASNWVNIRLLSKSTDNWAVSIYNGLGYRVKENKNSALICSDESLTLDFSGMPPGIYYVQLVSEKFSAVRKIFIR